MRFIFRKTGNSNLRSRASVFGRNAGLMLAVFAAFIVGMASVAQAAGFWDSVKERGALRCAYASAPPFEMKDLRTGEYQGAYLDLCKEFAKVLGVKVQFIDTSWDNVIAGLQSNKWDIVPALDRTPERAMVVNFSIPAGANQTTIAYLKNSEKFKSTPTRSMVDNANIRIGVISGTANDRALTAGISKAQIVRLPSDESADLALMSGRVDALAKATPMNLLLQAAHPDQVEILNPEPAFSNVKVAFGLPRSVSYQDMQVFNIFLEQKVATGEVEAAMKHYSEVVVSGANQ